jgi:hypothetical protein
MSEPPGDAAGAKTANRWVAHYGNWQFERGTAIYLGPTEAVTGVVPIVLGLAVSNLRLQSGSVEGEITLSGEHPSGRFVLGFDPASGQYWSVGIGGTFAYSLDTYEFARGWALHRGIGPTVRLDTDRPYHVRVELLGQTISLLVDGVTAFVHQMPSPPPGDGVGVLAMTPDRVVFDNVRASATPPKIFVVMQYGEPYDSLYREVVQPVCAERGYEAYRADDVSKPGLILEDIIRGIRECYAIVAEVTPVNANVFYELGYAHALEKPTILLAERGAPLPFDITGYRRIAYDNTISGKSSVESALREHLANI